MVLGPWVQPPDASFSWSVAAVILQSIAGARTTAADAVVDALAGDLLSFGGGDGRVGNSVINWTYNDTPDTYDGVAFTTVWAFEAGDFFYTDNPDLPYEEGPEGTTLIDVTVSGYWHRGFHDPSESGDDGELYDTGLTSFPDWWPGTGSLVAQSGSSDGPFEVTIPATDGALYLGFASHGVSAGLIAPDNGTGAGVFSAVVSGSASGIDELNFTVTLRPPRYRLLDGESLPMTQRQRSRRAIFT